jgi:hypothetical protein
MASLNAELEVTDTASIASSVSTEASFNNEASVLALSFSSGFMVEEPRIASESAHRAAGVVRFAVCNDSHGETSVAVSDEV